MDGQRSRFRIICYKKKKKINKNIFIENVKYRCKTRRVFFFFFLIILQVGIKNYSLNELISGR